MTNLWFVYLFKHCYNSVIYIQQVTCILRPYWQKMHKAIVRGLVRCKPHAEKASASTASGVRHKILEISGSWESQSGRGRARASGGSLPHAGSLRA